MSFKITGIITNISAPQTFASGSKKLVFVVKNNDGYNGEERFYAFEYFAGASKVDKITKFTQFNKVGKTVEVSFDIESREYKGKWYTGLRAFKVFGKRDEEDDDQLQHDYDTIAGGAPAALSGDTDDDLPF